MLSFRSLRLVVLLITIVGVTAADVAVPPAYRYQVDILASEIPKPMELETSSDGRIFYNDIYGELYVYHTESGTIVRAGKLDVFTEQENGFLGFALDPEFSLNQWIYLFYSPKELPIQRLSRFVMDGDRLDLGSEVIVLEFGIQRERCCHHAGSVEFAPDGCLLISTGDNTDPGADTKGYAPIDERPGHGPIDAQKSSANTHDLRGKILRIRPTIQGGYEIPDGNLFPKDGSEGRPEIYVMGCRNPWRMSVDSDSGIVYWGEVGPDAGGETERGPRGYDEINQARKAGNYGWPYFVGPNLAYADHDFATGENGPKYDPLIPINESPNNTGSRVLPPAQSALIYWPYGKSESFPSLGTGGRTACAGPVFRFRPEFAETNGFPEFYDGCLLFWDWQRPFIKWARLGADSSLQGIEPFTESVVALGEGQDSDREDQFVLRRPVDAQFGADGCLYMLDYGSTWGSNRDSKLVKVSYLRGNLPPIARLQLEPSAGREPLSVRASASESYDLEGDTIHFRWLLHPDGKALGDQEGIEVVLSEPGDRVLELIVTDEKGASMSTSRPIVVGNTEPKIAFLSPQEGDFFTPGEPLAYQVQATDVEDGDSLIEDEVMGPRIGVTVRFKNSPDEEEAVAEGLALMRGSDCFNCHKVEEKLVGPAFLAIANRYRGVEGALESSVSRVLKGSSGVWGSVPMLPHSQLGQQEISKMVRWVFDLKPGAASVQAVRGGDGVLKTVDEGNIRFAVLEAVYTDGGRKLASTLSSETSVRLRTRLVEAEHCDRFAGLKLETRGLGSIAHGHSATFENVNLSDTRGITVQVSSGGPGGRMELRENSVDGDLIAFFDVDNTGGWGEQVQVSTKIEPRKDRVDLVLHFVNEGKGGLMNVDWLRFDP